MSLDAIRQVSDAQAKASAALAAQSSEARRIVSDADAAGREKLESVRRQCAESSASLLAMAREEAALKSRGVLDGADRDCAGLTADAQKHLPDAVRIIVGRVVNA